MNRSLPQNIIFNEDELRYSGERIVSTNIFRIKVPNIEKYKIRKFVFRCYLSKKPEYPGYTDKDNLQYILVRTKDSGTRIVPYFYLDKSRYFNHEFAMKGSNFNHFDKYFRVALSKVKGYIHYIQLDFISFDKNETIYTTIFKMNEELITLDEKIVDPSNEFYGLFNECVPSIETPDFSEDPIERYLYGNPSITPVESSMITNKIMNIPFMVNPKRIKIKKIDGFYSAVIPLYRKPKIEKSNKTKKSK